MREGYFWDVGLGVFICKVCEYAGDTEDEMQHHACPGTPWFKRDALEHIKTLRFQGEPPARISPATAQEVLADPKATKEQIEWAHSQTYEVGQAEPSVRDFWQQWHDATFGNRVDQYLPFYGWRDVAWKFAEAYAQQQVRGLQITSDGWKETAGYLSERAKTAERALHDLTPGGSEFVNDVPRCVAWIRQRFANDHEITKKAIIAKKALEQALRELRDDILRTEGVGRVGSLEVAVKRINKLLAETV